MYKHVLMPVDLDQPASWDKALPVAVGMCRGFDARLTVMTVVPGFTMTVVEQYFPPETMARMITDANTRLEAFVADNLPAGLSAATLVAEGKIYQEIIATAAATGAEIIVMASHSPELRDYLLGPNAARVVRHAPVSVLVVR